MIMSGMGRLALSIAVIVTVAIQTLANWRCAVGERLPPPDNSSRPLWAPFWIGLAASFVVQVIGWSVFAQLPDRRKIGPWLGLPLATTLMTIGPGMFISIGVPHGVFEAAEATG